MPRPAYFTSKSPGEQPPRQGWRTLPASIQLAVAADCELQRGHIAAAERLAWRAADLRDAGE